MSKKRFPHQYLLHRLQHSKHEHCLWQSNFAAYDYPLWSLRNVWWQFNPFSGKQYLAQLNDNPDAERLIHLPDCSYWEAVGLHHPREDGTVKVKDEGVWINPAERAWAEDDNQFVTSAMYQSRQPSFNRAIPNYRTARRSASQTAGRASSRGTAVRRDA